MTTETSFQPSDVVQLKLGGKLLTVRDIPEEGYVQVYYADSQGLPVRHDGYLADILLRKVDPADILKSTESKSNHEADNTI